MMHLEEKWVLPNLLPPTHPPTSLNDTILLASHEQHRHVVLQFVDGLNGRLSQTYRYPNAHLDGIILVGQQFVLTLTTHDLINGQAQVMAFGAEGQPLWSHVAGHNLSAPCATPDGIAYIQDTKQIVTLTNDGTVLTTIPLPDNVTWRTLRYHAGLFYLASETHLAALLPNGTEVWQATVTDPRMEPFTAFSPLPVDDSLLVMVSAKGYLLAYDQDTGEQLWVQKVGKRERPLFPATDQQKLYVGARDGLFTYDLQGNRGWVYIPKDPQTHQSQAILAPPVLMDGRVYLVSRNRTLEILDPVTGSLQAQSAQMERGLRQTPCLVTVEDNILVVMADAGGTLVGLSHRNPAIKRLNIEYLTEEMWQRLNTASLQDLGFRLKNRTNNRGYLYDALPSQGLRGKINALLDLAQIQGELELVLEMCRILVPGGNWDEVYE